jgi:hypothetical protein
MRLKRAIQIVEYTNLSLIVVLVAGVIFFVVKSPDGKLIFLEMLIAIPFILAFLFKKVLIKRFLRKSQYPGVFYSVLDKMRLTKDIDFDLPETLLDEVYKPPYSTERFVADNKLVTEIGPKRPEKVFNVMCLTLGTAWLIYSVQRFRFQDKPFLFAGSLFLIGLPIYLWSKTRTEPPAEGKPLVRFRSEGLYVNELRLNWKNIYDWNCVAGKDGVQQVVINFYDEDRNIQETIANLPAINSDKIDFLILLTHFKGKYGQTSETA